MKLFKTIFPVNKTYDELEEPVRDLLNKKLIIGIFLSVLAVVICFIKSLNFIRLPFLFATVAYVFTCIYTWYLFITDSVCSLEAIYEGTNLKEATNDFEEKRNKRKTQKIYVTKDNVRVAVVLHKHENEFSKGDLIKLYTVPNNIVDKANGTVEVTNTLCIFIVKSADNKENEDDNENVDNK